MNNFRMILGLGGSVAAMASGATGGQDVSQKIPRKIELTVYREDFAMVSENRPVVYDAGHTRIVIDDISKHLDPNSVLFDWPLTRDHPRVVATTYNLGIGTGSSLLSRLNGQEVSLMLPSSDGKQGELITGRLEAAADGSSFALRTADRLYINPTGTVIASPKTASGLPQLSVELEGSGAGNTQVGLSYLTRGMSWSADYVAKLNSKANTVEIECWATVTNTTGIPFPDARITLMAGSPNRSVANVSLVNGDSTLATHGAGLVRQDGIRIGEYSVTGGSPSEGNVVLNAPRSSVGDLYAYKIPSTASIGVDQMNRVSVLGTRTVPIKKIYSVQIPTLTSWGYIDEDPSTRSHRHVPALVSMVFSNDKGSNLGVPLPAGSVRVYEKDDSGQARYTGADHIADTPKNERVSLTLSGAFDVYAGYSVLKSEKIAKKKLRKTVAVTLHNEKKTSVQMRLVQDFSNPWSLVSETSKSEKVDSNSLQWNLQLKPGEQRRVLFTIDIKE